MIAKTRDMTGIEAALGVLVFFGLLAMGFIHLALEAWVIMKLWAWFAANATGVTLSFWQAVGITCLISLAVSSHQKTKDHEIDIACTICSMFLNPTYALIIGYIAHRMTT